MIRPDPAMIHAASTLAWGFSGVTRASVCEMATSNNIITVVIVIVITATLGVCFVYNLM